MKAKPKTNLESSVRLSAPVRQQYDDMAAGNRGQKTDVMAAAALRLAEILQVDPAAFRGPNRPWLKGTAAAERPI